MKQVLVFLTDLFNFISNLRVQNLAFLAILLLLIWLLIVNRRLRKKLKDEIEDVKFHVQKIDKKLELKRTAEEIRAEHKKEKLMTEEPKKEEEFLEIEKTEWHGPGSKTWEIPKSESESILELRPEPEKTPEHKIKIESKKKVEIDRPIKLTEEYIFVLRAIGDEPDKTYQKEGLHQLFRMVYPKKDKMAFESIIKGLEKYNFITKSDASSGYKVWYEITDKGLAYFNRNA